MTGGGWKGPPTWAVSRAGWNQAKVAEWIDHLFKLAYEDEVMPRMRAALSTTRSLIAEQSDPHLQVLLERTADIADKTCQLALDPLLDTESPGLSSAWDAAPLSEPLQRGVLPKLIALLEEPDANFQEIRKIAHDFLDGPAKLLRTLADEMETEFGRILAIQQQEYPTLAAPTMGMGNYLMRMTEILDLPIDQRPRTSASAAVREEIMPGIGAGRCP